MDAMEHVIEVTDETFEQVVVEGSKTAPVVVDLWADWCGPCRTLGPMLEEAATKRDGAFTLAKIDVDAQGVGNALLQAVRSQSIPTVVAFRDGQPVSMFIGAIPQPEIDRFLSVLTGSLPVPEYFTPRRMLRLIGVRGVWQAMRSQRKMRT